VEKLRETMNLFLYDQCETTITPFVCKKQYLSVWPLFVVISILGVLYLN